MDIIYQNLIDYARYLIGSGTIIEPEDLVNEALIRDKELTDKSRSTIKRVYYELREGYVSNDFTIAEPSVKETSAICVYCQELLPIAAFGFVGHFYRQTACKQCDNKQSKRWNNNNKERIKKRRFLDSYHMTESYLRQRLFGRNIKAKNITSEMLDIEKVKALIERTNYDKVINRARSV